MCHFECKELWIKHSSCLQVIGHSTKHHNTLPSLPIIITIVACVVGPSVNPLQIKETQHVNIVLQCMYWIFWTTKYERKSCLNWMVSLKVLPRSQLIFPFKTWFFWEFIWTFSSRNHLKNQYLPHFESKSYQINSIKSGSSSSFQQHQRHIPPPSKFSATI